jgi:probable O-glycosylation ligase (exosortase A-associated)
MRDIVVTLAVFIGLFLTIRKPFFGILTWTWLGLMNPHMLCWGFAYGFPFAQLVALATLGAILINNQEKRQIPWFAVSKVEATWWAWMLFTTFFALNPAGAWSQWDKVWKIQLFVFVTMMLLTSKERINALVWVMMVSLGLYGVKGGAFTLLTGGSYHVMGPFGTFIGGNNEIGLALIMTVPLMRYVQLQADSMLLRSAMIASMGLTVVAILGTQSRGALVGITAMITYLVLKSRKKGALIALLLLLLPFAYMFMPETWHERMDTIQTYEEDKSASGRINAWWTAWNIAVDRPFVGGGFETFREWIVNIYEPRPGEYTARDVHSIYFEALAEHGFVGLALFLMLGLAGILTARKIVRETKNEPRLFWMRDLASMIHVSLIGYAASGAFLGLAYFDFYYTLLAVLVGLQSLLKKYKTEGIPDTETAAISSRELVGPGSGGAPRTAKRVSASGGQGSLTSKLKEFYHKL